jgi:hypothetical protein
MTHTINGATLALIQGNIVDVQVDAIIQIQGFHRRIMMESCSFRLN